MALCGVVMAFTSSCQPQAVMLHGGLIHRGGARPAECGDPYGYTIVVGYGTRKYTPAMPAVTNYARTLVFHTGCSLCIFSNAFLS
jgi:hypothetical protein